MAERIDQLVAALEKTNADFTAFVEGLSDAQWHTLVPIEQRTVGVVAHHVAEGLVGTVGTMSLICNSQSLPFTVEQLNQGNAKHAMEHANVTKAETLAVLQANGAKAKGMLNSFSDAQLDNSGGVPFSAQPMS